jgi:hypothetical protein
LCTLCTGHVRDSVERTAKEKGIGPETTSAAVEWWWCSPAWENVSFAQQAGTGGTTRTVGARTVGTRIGIRIAVGIDIVVIDDR